MIKKLSEYKKKRDFSKTTEPKPKTKRKKPKEPIFVIQKHDATRLHYDFRLEIDGTLKSWAVPKGPSMNPQDKRLAIETEDHPLEYAEFEGVIPKGQYGAGPVLIWDYGTYKNLKKDRKGKPIDMSQCYTEERIEVWIEGKKITGGYALIKMADKNWLLIKMKDEHASARKNPVISQPKSAVSGKTLKQISNESKHGNL